MRTTIIVTLPDGGWKMNKEVEANNRQKPSFLKCCVQKRLSKIGFMGDDV